MVKTEYPGLLADDRALHAEAKVLAAKTYELSQFLVEVLKVSEVGSTFSGKLTYHDSCHLLRGLGESRSPRTLLRSGAPLDPYAPLRSLLPNLLPVRRTLSGRGASRALPVALAALPPAPDKEG